MVTWGLLLAAVAPVLLKLHKPTLKSPAIAMTAIEAFP